MLARVVREMGKRQKEKNRKRKELTKVLNSK
jgi:hypothetical protein